MANPSSDRNETIIRSILFIAVVLLAVGIIIFLKHSSDVPLTPEGFAARDSIQRMATPDTTTAPIEDFTSTDTDSSLPTDTVSMDLRLPSDAGYEDGYFAGLQDGLDDMERASYDNTSKFPTEAQRRNYTDAYKRGYAQGFADGQNQGEEEAPLNEEPTLTPPSTAPKTNVPSTKPNNPTSHPPHATPPHSTKSPVAPKSSASPTK